MSGERAPDPLPETRLRPRGSNQGGMRQFNERVVLQAIRLQGSCPKAEIARLTHLTAQTVQIIIARLEADELVRKLAPVRGKVGQPSVPMALNPDGAFSIGVKIGRRSMDMLLVDFTGQVRERLSLDYPFPDPDTLFIEIGTRLRQLRKALKPALRERLHGIGVAAPLSLGGWNELLGIAPELAAKWHGIDMRERMAALGATAGLPVEFVKDTAAACVAELVAGRGRSIRSFLYVFVDTFIGGGLVLDSHLSGGVTGNAGAVGSLPMGLGNRAARPPEQLLNIASLWNLEALYAKAGVDVNAWTDARALAEPWLPSTRAWLGEACPGHRTGHQQRCLSARSGRRDHRRFIRPRVAALADARGRERARPLQLGRCGTAAGAGRHHRQRCARHRRGAAAAVCEFRAGSGPVPEDRQDEWSCAMSSPQSDAMQRIAALPRCDRTGAWNALKNHYDTARLRVRPARRLRAACGSVRGHERAGAGGLCRPVESNGKRVDADGEPLPFGTSPVVWGEPGTNGQHAYFQMLHQGTDVIPVEFILVKTPTHSLHDLHTKLLANGLAQSQALMRGKSTAEASSERAPTASRDLDALTLAKHRSFPGNRPSTTLILDQLTPRSLGALIALYEHRVFASGALWGINSFDQWGVELGKALCADLLPRLATGGDLDGLDASTAGLIQRLRSA